MADKDEATIPAHPRATAELVGHGEAEHLLLDA